MPLLAGQNGEEGYFIVTYTALYKAAEDSIGRTEAH